MCRYSRINKIIIYVHNIILQFSTKISPIIYYLYILYIIYVYDTYIRIIRGYLARCRRKFMKRFQKNVKKVQAVTRLLTIYIY